jgi:transcription antitermination factor NusG
LASIALAPFPAEPSPWYVLRAESGRELLAHQYLTNIGIDTYLPTYETKRRVHRVGAAGGVQAITRALFQGYAFARFAWPERMAVLQSPAIMDILTFAQQPALVPDAEVQAIRAMATAGLATPWQMLKAGQRVRIKSGSLRGQEGILIRQKDSLRVVVTIEMLRRAVAITVAGEDLEAA